jgi:hypothetical protein
MDFTKLAEQAISLAKIAGNVLPGLSGGAAIAEKILDVVDDLKQAAPDSGSAEDLEAAHKALYKEMTDKGHALSARLRG